MRLVRTLVIGLTLCVVCAPAVRAGSLEDAAADAAADTAGAILGLPPADAPPKPPKKINVARCRRIAKQIVHFENVKDMADERDNALWVKATQDHIEGLEGQWWSECDDREDEFAKAFSKALKLAARAAVKYFTWGGF